MCPITLDIMFEPYATTIGNSYEQSQLQECIKKNGYRDPLTQEYFGRKFLIQNKVFKKDIKRFLLRHPECWDSQDFYTDDNGNLNYKYDLLQYNS